MKNLLSLLCLLCISSFSGYAQKITFSPQWSAQSQFAGYYAALEKGFYDEAGLDVSIVHPSNSYSSINMLKDGTTDFITCELIQAMMASDKGIRLVNLLQTTQHTTLVLISHEKNISKMSDLAGRRIGTWKVGFSEIPYIIDKEHKLGVEWVKFINPLNIYISRAIDATLGKSYNEGILFSMSGITPGSLLRFSEMGYDYPEDGLYVSEAFFKKNPNVCRKFAEASRKGWEWVRNNRKEAVDIVMKYVKEANVSTNIYVQKWMLEEVLEMQEDEKGEAPSYQLNANAFYWLNDVLLKHGYISRPVEYERLTGGKQ
jgi:NitT/TauT family transport system substrate-binding protein